MSAMPNYSNVVWSGGSYNQVHYHILNETDCKKSDGGTLRANGIYTRIPKREELKIRAMIGRNIRQARIENKLSLQTVADELGYQKSKLSEIENGKKEPGSVLLFQLADLFLVSPSYFYTGVDVEASEEALFDFSRLCQKVWIQQSKQYAVACYRMLIESSRVDSSIEELISSASELIDKGYKMIERNNDGAWQEMKSGNSFLISLNQLSNKLSQAKVAYNLHKRSITAKEAEQGAQLMLDLTRS